MNETNFTVYFDMDGVLAVFDEQCPKEKVRKPGGHYFRTCDPDSRAVALANALNGFPNINVKILTRLFESQPPEPKREQTADKRLWCVEKLPFTDETSVDSIFICLDGHKNVVLESVPPEERPLHILVDDDPENLCGWTQAGGYAVQYIQPERTVARWNGMRIESGQNGAHAMMLLLEKINRARIRSQKLYQINRKEEQST